MLNTKGVLLEKLMNRKVILVFSCLVTILIYGTSTVLNHYFPIQLTPYIKCMTRERVALPIVISNLTIAISYFVISGSLIYSVLKRNIKRHFMNFPSLVFGIFILFCGTKHVIGVVTIWYPTYWAAIVISIITAIISVLVASVISYRISYLTTLPDVRNVARINKKLERRIVLLKATHPYDTIDDDLNSPEDLEEIVETLKRVSHFLGTPANGNK